MKPFALLLLALSLTPAVSAQIAPTATVYFYRPQNAVGSKGSPTIICDQKSVAVVRNGQYVSVSLPAGKHVLDSTLAGSKQTVVLDPDTVYYFRVDMSQFSWRMVISGKLTLVLPQQGRSDVAQLQAVDPLR